MFNSKVYNGDQKNPSWYCPAGEDPMLDMLVEYDKILGRLMRLNCRLFIATGLHQKAHTKTTFYWRLKNHMDFLKAIGIPSVLSVVPRMSRDFLVESSTNLEAKNIEDILNSIVAFQTGEKIFSVDNRGKSLFIELIYPHDIKRNFKISRNGTELGIDFSEHVSFVAIKNGEHDGLGYFVDTNQKFSPEQVMPVKEIFTQISNSF